MLDLVLIIISFLPDAGEWSVAIFGGGASISKTRNKYSKAGTENNQYGSNQQTDTSRTGQRSVDSARNNLMNSVANSQQAGTTNMQGGTTQAGINSMQGGVAGAGQTSQMGLSAQQAASQQAGQASSQWGALPQVTGQLDNYLPQAAQAFLGGPGPRYAGAIGQAQGQIEGVMGGGSGDGDLKQLQMDDIQRRMNQQFSGMGRYGSAVHQGTLGRELGRFGLQWEQDQFGRDIQGLQAGVGALQGLQNLDLNPYTQYANVLGQVGQLGGQQSGMNAQTASNMQNTETAQAGTSATNQQNFQNQQTQAQATNFQNQQMQEQQQQRQQQMEQEQQRQRELEVEQMLSNAIEKGHQDKQYGEKGRGSGTSTSAGFSFGTGK